MPTENLLAFAGWLPYAAEPMHSTHAQKRRWSWFVVSAHYGQTIAVLHRLEKLGREVYVPIVSSEYGKRPVPLFGEYLFVRFTPGWEHVRYARGVSGVLNGAGGQLGLVDNIFIKKLKALEDYRGIVVLDGTGKSERNPPVRRRTEFADGEVVVPTEGAFIGSLGIVKGAPRDNLVTVLFSLLGRDLEVEFNVGDVEIAA